jgi:hypothetical protein
MLLIPNSFSAASFMLKQVINTTTSLSPSPKPYAMGKNCLEPLEL